MRLIRLLYRSCLFLGYLLLTAGPAAAAALDQPLPAPPHPSLPGSIAAQATTPTARVLTFDADVNPVTAAYVKRGIELAERDGNSILVIQLNTPGGQLDSMEEITQDILNSRVPVMVYVSPSGAWAASAGVFITYASHVAVMAPGTTIGSAHPVLEGTAPAPATTPDPQQTPVSGTSEQELLQKITNFSVAHLRNIAEIRGRNADWAERSIRESVAATAPEAVDQHIVDYMAATLTEALDKADGRVVSLGDQKVTLHTKGATLIDTPMNNIEGFLLLLTNSSLAYTLITLGGLALTAEVFNPGLVFPGVAGVIMLLLGLVALGMLPVNLTGVVLIGFAFVLFIADLFMTTHGILTAGGVASLALGGLLLIDTSQAPGVPAVSPGAIVALAGTIGAAFFFGIYKAFQARRRQPTTGVEGMMGRTAEVREPLAPRGMVFFEGALWRAVSTNGPIPVGREVQVTGIDGLTLYVRPVEDVPAPVEDPTKTVPLGDA
jgi:membrane-bound serine protease (ClpP class)